jgi:cathepsin F/cysteine peptidase B
VAGHDLTALSVQQVVSCDNGNGDMGCQGGWYYTAWEDYMEASHGLTTEAEYPYDDSTAHGSASKCDTAKAKDVVPGTTPGNFTWATTPCEKYFCKNQDEETLKANLLSYGPISVACDASEWSFYKGGVVTSSTCKNSGVKLDHAIQLVGFNEDAEVPYWIVRNSWNTNWGNEGYIYLKMGENTCGIADMPAMVTIEPAVNA